MTQPLPPIKTAAVIAVGSELLGTSRIDTNSLYLSGRLGALGIELRGKAVVGDDRAELARVFAGALATSGLVILTGGLGPTDDDVTRDAITVRGREHGVAPINLRIKNEVYEFACGSTRVFKLD